MLLCEGGVGINKEVLMAGTQVGGVFGRRVQNLCRKGRHADVNWKKRLCGVESQEDRSTNVPSSVKLCKIIAEKEVWLMLKFTCGRLNVIAC